MKQLKHVVIHTHEKIIVCHKKNVNVYILLQKYLHICMKQII